MSFGLEIGRWAKDAANDIAKKHEVITLELFRSVILQTPVGNPDNWKYPDSAPEGYAGGRLRANWQISSNTPASGEVDTIDSTGRNTVGDVQQFLQGLDFTDDVKVFLTNNLPYAHRIEFEGHSGQAPEGMVRKNLIRITNNLRG